MTDEQKMALFKLASKAQWATPGLKLEIDCELLLSIAREILHKKEAA